MRTHSLPTPTMSGGSVAVPLELGDAPLRASRRSPLRVQMLQTVGDRDIVRIWGLRNGKARMTAEPVSNTRRSHQAVTGKLRARLSPRRTSSAPLTFILLLVMDPLFGAPCPRAPFRP